MNLKQAIKQKVGNKKYPKKLRIKIGRALFVFASLPLFSAWAFAIALPMMMPMSPTLWAKDKIRWFREGRSLK